MIINRYEKNPILTKNDFKSLNENLVTSLAFNPGVIKYNGKVILIARVACEAKKKEGFIGVPYYDGKNISVMYFDLKDKNYDYTDPRVIRKGSETFLTTLSYFVKCESDDGVNFKVSDTPFMIGDNIYESYGIEDPRIVKIGDTYYINYSGVSKYGIVTSLAKTNDFVNVTKLGPIFMPDNKDVVIFPDKINGYYYCLSRPESAYFKTPNIWISKSEDLASFGHHELFMSIREDSFDSARIGASCVPFLTEYGYVLIYHGATIDNRYTLGVALLDKNDPSKIIKRSKSAFMVPESKYETDGFMKNVIFSCGCYYENGIIHLYYGASDESICYAKFSLKDLMDFLN